MEAVDQPFDLYFYLSIWAGGPLLLFILFFIFSLFPPKKINSLYGYRTPNSMKSQENWDFANRYSNRLALVLFFIFSILASAHIVVLYHLELKPTDEMTTVMMLVYTTLPLLPMILLTERALKNRQKN
jgi:uncharacterized membrane protein